MSSATNSAVVARTIEASRWGLPVGADYGAQRWPDAKFDDPETFVRLEERRWPMLYVDTSDALGRSASPRAAYGRVTEVRILPMATLPTPSRRTD